MPGFFLRSYHTRRREQSFRRAGDLILAKKPVCLVCQKEMVRGFMTERAHAGSVNLPRWCEGEPKPDFWAKHVSGGDAASVQHAQGFAVVAYRCPECEALRLYAPSTHD